MVNRFSSESRCPCWVLLYLLGDLNSSIRAGNKGKVYSQEPTHQKIAIPSNLPSSLYIGWTRWPLDFVRAVGSIIHRLLGRVKFMPPQHLYDWCRSHVALPFRGSEISCCVLLFKNGDISFIYDDDFLSCSVTWYRVVGSALHSTSPNTFISLRLFLFFSSSSYQGRWARGRDGRRHNLLGKTKPKGWNGTVLNGLARVMRADRWVRCTSQQCGLVGLALDVKCIWHNASTWSALSSIPTLKLHAFRIVCQSGTLSACLLANVPNLKEWAPNSQTMVPVLHNMIFFSL